jgi:hypothetical protein
MQTNLIMEYSLIRLLACNISKISLFLTLSAFSIANAQNSVSGRVTDAQTGEPIPFVNVFFANTSFGASTGMDGEYSFSGFPSGKYDLTFTYIGYVTVQQSLEFDGATKYEYPQKLEQESKVLSEVLIKPDTAGWKRNYADFRYHFLGTSPYAAKCEIKNPKNIFLYFDKRDGVLVAHARDAIVVENNATGYRIKYYLNHFEFQSRTGLFTIYGLPQFEEMTPKNERVHKRWLKERQKIYQGSLMHFIRSWHSYQWKENDFKVSRLYRVPNKERPTDEFLNQKIKRLREKVLASGGSSTLRLSVKNGTIDADSDDSLAYYFRLRNLPKEVDSLISETLTGKEFISDSDPHRMSYNGLLHVQYKELEDPLYAQMVGRAEQRTRQRSVLHVLGDLKLYDNGYYEDVRHIFLENYWSWSEKIATLLPLDYQPPLED